MAERKHGEAAPATQTTLAGADWYGLDISDRNDSRTLFSDLDMTEATSAGAVFKECTFRRAKFNCSRHEGSAFINCTFVGCNFYDVIFNDCKFVGSMFDGCKFDATRVKGGNWSFVGLPGADLRSAVFADTVMREADLTGARCEGGTMNGLDLSGSWLHSANFSGCDLRGSDISSIEPETVTLKRAVITIEQSVMICEAMGLMVRAS
ncbi:MAG: pentapeptide repeat-containing protein [Ensifer adhaerens]